MRIGQVRTEAEQLFSETQIHGKKLEGMVTNANSIASQAVKKGNAWYWARHELTQMTGCLQEVEKALSTYQAHCKPPNTLASLQTKTEGTASAWLTAHKTTLQTATDKLHIPLGELMGMHASKIKHMTTLVKTDEDKKSGKKRKKSEPHQSEA